MTQDQFHTIHSDNPNGNEPARPGRFCGPDCDLFEDPEPAPAAPAAVTLTTWDDVHPFQEPPFGYVVNDANPSGAMVPDDRARCGRCGVQRWAHKEAMDDLAAQLPQPAPVRVPVANGTADGPATLKTAPAALFGVQFSDATLDRMAADAARERSEGYLAHLSSPCRPPRAWCAFCRLAARESGTVVR